MKKLFVLTVAFVFGTTALFAQEVSDEKFDKFAEAYQSVQKENNNAQQEMVAVIESEGLTTQRFNEIQQASLDPNKESDASAKEKKQHQAAVTKLEAMNEKLQAKMVKKIEESGLSEQEYQQVYQVIQTNPEMQQKLMARFQGEGQK